MHGSSFNDIHFVAKELTKLINAINPNLLYMSK